MSVKTVGAIGFHTSVEILVFFRISFQETSVKVGGKLFGGDPFPRDNPNLGTVSVRQWGAAPLTLQNNSKFQFRWGNCDVKAIMNLCAMCHSPLSCPSCCLGAGNWVWAILWQIARITFCTTRVLELLGGWTEEVESIVECWLGSAWTVPLAPYFYAKFYGDTDNFFDNKQNCGRDLVGRRYFYCGCSSTQNSSALSYANIYFWYVAGF